MFRKVSGKISRTMVFNVLALVVAVAAAFGYQGNLPEAWGVFVPVIVIIINLILRKLTNEPLA